MAASVLASCAHSPLVWDYYDQCALQNPSFLAMAECGRQKRLAACVPNDTCSPEGTTFMEYVDSLAVSVKTKKLTETEAMRRHTEYKSGGMSTRKLIRYASSLRRSGKAIASTLVVCENAGLRKYRI